MFELFVSKFIAGMAAISMAITGLFVPTPEIDVTYLEVGIEELEAELGAVRFVAGERYRIAGGGITATADSITLQKFQTLDGRELAMSNFGDTGWLTLEPGTSKKEFISFTGVSQSGSSDEATLTGVSRGLDFIYPYTATSTLRQTHSGGALVIISNPPQLYNQAAFKANDETITGSWLFSAIAGYSSGLSFTTDHQIITKKYADDLAIAGAPDSSQTTKGLVEEATLSELISATSTGGTSAPLFVPNQYFATTTSATTSVPVTNSSGKLSQGFLDLTEDWTFSGSNTYSGTTTFSGTSTVSGAMTFSGSVSGLVDYQTFTSNATWTKPVIGNMVFIQVWGAGGSGGKTQNNRAGGGGGGGAYTELWLPFSSMGATETITIGTGGAAITAADTNGNVGGNTTVGSLLTGYGGGGGRGDNATASGGGGGGSISAGATAATAVGGLGGNPSGVGPGSGGTIGVAGGANSDGGGGGGGYDNGAPGAGGASHNGGGGGGGGDIGSPNTSGLGGASFNGGGGGGGGAFENAAAAGGVSTNGGNGGAGGYDGNAAVDGTFPSGGGGGTETGTSGAGADGQVKITVF